MTFKRLVSFSVLLVPVVLAACGGGGSSAGGTRYAGLECAPFARELSGVALYGPAADWWTQAAERYQRSSVPQVGSVLVLARQPRLPSGHVSVVSRVLAARQIAVIQANWVRDELDLDQLVVDVSPGNDWTSVRVWFPPVGQLGAHAYDALGFILSPERVDHDTLSEASAAAARLSLSSARGRPEPRARSYGS